MLKKPGKNKTETKLAHNKMKHNSHDHFDFLIPQELQFTVLNVQQRTEE